jgi:capsular polysaccharide biosynthesis protein
LGLANKQYDMNMNISYRAVSEWFRGNLKLLIILEVACLLVAGIYFFIAPRVYEANFSISLPKVSVTPETNPLKFRLMISPQEFIRPTQNPMAYSDAFVKECMGEDTNANRKKMIQGLQLGVKQQGDVIAFTLRLEGAERPAKCAALMMQRAFDDLTASQDIYLQARTPGAIDPATYVRPALVQSIRMSDSYIKPDLYRILTIGFLAGIFLTVFVSLMRKKYRA